MKIIVKEETKREVEISDEQAKEICIKVLEKLFDLGIQNVFINRDGDLMTQYKIFGRIEVEKIRVATETDRNVLGIIKKIKEHNK